MRLRGLATSILAVLAAGIFLASCSQGPKAVKTTPQKKAAPPSAAAKGVPPDGLEASRPKPPAPLPVLEKEDINGDSHVQAEKSAEPDKEAARILEEGFAAYQEAQTAIDQGDMDTAEAKLDEAYGIMLKVKLPADSSLLQEKNDLRRLIAQRIQQVSASRMTYVPSVNDSIPLVENRWVQKEITSFQTVEKPWFIEAYKRSGLYKDMIIAELRAAGLPERLVWVPMIESWFKVRALSRARALGLWQFISSTGYRYGLKKDKYVDERMDPAKATKAAVQYLSDLHAMFGDWTTALAAYNCGEANVQRVIRAQKIDYLDNFWDLFNNLPWETARYVPRFIAAMMILEDPAKYGFELPEADPPLKSETVRINTPVKLSSLAQSLGVDSLLLTILNPELRFDSTPNYDYDLRVPEGYGEKCLACVATLPSYIPPDAAFSGWHTVRPGETLGVIARRYQTTVTAMARVNGLANARLIYPGQKLRIPGTAGVSGAPDTGKTPAQAPAASPAVKAEPGETVTYVVKVGDTLFQIAKTYNTSVEKIKADNKLASDELVVGQKLTIQNGRS